MTNGLRYVDKLTADFFERFKKDYLKEQGLHYERRRQVRDLQLGEVVLIAADNIQRQEWIMGEVIEIFPSIDGVARSACDCGPARVCCDGRSNVSAPSS